MKTEDVNNSMCGRKDIMAVINRRILSLTEGYRQNIALIGKEGCGKSTILRKILETNKEANPVVIYVELKDEDIRSFARRFIGAILYYSVKAAGNEPVENMDILLEMAEGPLRETVPFLKTVLPKIKAWEGERIFENLLTALAKLESDLKGKCIIMLDEFHKISKFGLREPFRRFGESIMVMRNIMFIMTSSACIYSKKVLKNEFSMLFGNFEIIDIGPLSYLEAVGLIRERLGDKALNDKYKKFLFYFTDGNPFYLSAILEKLSERMDVKGIAVDDPYTMLADVLNITIFETKGLLNQYFAKHMESFLLDPSGKDYALSLLAMTNGRAMREDAHRVSLMPKHKIKEKLRLLINEDLISKIGSMYRFDDKLMRFWLKSSYYRKRTAFSSNPPFMSLSFKDEIQKELESFIAECDKPSAEKIVGLLNYFDNEVVSIKDKARKMLKFDAAELRQVGKDTHLIFASSSKSTWTIFLKEGDISEDDILNFNKLSSRDGIQVNRKIVIHLGEIDINALLMAKEFKMWIWDIKTVNTLMDLYGKVQLVF